MLLGIDLGTSALKAMLFDPDQGNEPLVASAGISIDRPGPGLAEMDGNVLWEHLVAVLGDLRREHPSAWDAIEGIGLSVIFPGLLPLDASARPLTPAILYCDHRSRPQVDRIEQTFGRDRFEALTGNQLTPGTCTLPGLLWLREHRPDLMGQTAVFGQLSTFLVMRLTGRPVVDYTHASLSGLCSQGEEDQWFPELLETAGIEPDRLPALCASTCPAGYTEGPWAAACGLRSGIPVAAGSGDAPLAVLGGGVTGPGSLFVSAGTTDCIMVSASQPSGDPVFCNIHAATDADLWVVNGTMSSAGASVQWFCDQIMHADPEQITAWATAAAPGAGGLTYLPYLQGERTPWWNPDAKGVFFGLTLGSSRQELARAVLEGIACGWRQIVDMLETTLDTRAPHVLSVGGGSTNPFWNRIKATYLGRPVKALSVREITSLGACMIAGLAAGTFSDAQEAVAATDHLREQRTFDPVPEWQEAAERTFSTYQRLYPALVDLF